MPPLRLLRGSWPPLAAWLAALTGLWLVALVHGHDPWHAATWAHWDSTHYLEIADHGYAIHRCVAGGHAAWCGDAAWLPGYPLLVAGIHALGAPLAAAGVAVAWTAALAFLVTLWHAFLRALPPLPRAAGLLYAAWAPGQVYVFGVYPLSLLLLATVAYLHLLRRRRFGTAGIAGAAAALTYPVGVVLALAAAAWILLTRRHRRVRALAAACGPLPLAFVAVLAAQRIQTGRFTAFFDVERTYEHGIHDPLGAVSNAIILWHRTQSLEPENLKGLQTLVVTAILLAVLVHAAMRARTELDTLLLSFALVVWAFPLTQGNISVQRSQAALAPLAVLVARLPRPVVLVAVGTVIALSEPMARLYFDNRLI